MVLWFYWYRYALNNPLRFTDPSGYKYGPSDYERERRNGEGIYYNYELAWKMAGLTYRDHYSFYDHYTWVEGSVSSGWVRNEKIYNVDFLSFFDDLAADYNGDDFSLSLEFGYGDFCVIGNSSITGSKSSFGGLNDLNFESYAVATVFGYTMLNADLNWLGRKIQKYAGSEFSKHMFANFWTGGGDYTLSKPRFQDIIRNAKLNGKATFTVFNGQDAMKQPVSFYNTEYANVFGTATLFLDMSGNPIGFNDTYDFNPYPIRWNSFFNAQLKTEMVDMASWFNSSDKPFVIKYP